MQRFENKGGKEEMMTGKEFSKAMIAIGVAFVFLFLIFFISLYLIAPALQSAEEKNAEENECKTMCADKELEYHYLEKEGLILCSCGEDNTDIDFNMSINGTNASIEWDYEGWEQ